MKILKIRIGRRARIFALPANLTQRVALFMRGWRPAYLPHVPVPWWAKKE